MKKTLISFIILTALTSSAFAVSTPSEEDYKSMDEMRAKLVRLKREMDKFVKDIVATYPDQSMNTSNLFGQDVKVDIAETDKDVIVKADLPGMDKDKIEVTLMNNKTLKIAGSREMAKQESAPGIVRQERMSGRFERVLELPAECLSEEIKASYKSGVLEVDIPKKRPGKEEAVKVSIQ